VLTFNKNEGEQLMKKLLFLFALIGWFSARPLTEPERKP
jgi:hypothetical protein